MSGLPRRQQIDTCKPPYGVVPKRIPTGEVYGIPEGFQVVIRGRLRCHGRYKVHGNLKVV